MSAPLVADIEDLTSYPLVADIDDLTGVIPFLQIQRILK